MRNLLILTLILWGTGFVSGAAEPVKQKQDWEGQLPSYGASQDQWSALLSELIERKLYFGVVAAAERMLLYFGDAATKESAYRGIRSGIRGGYPFLLHGLFREGDLDPSDHDGFASVYFNYKGIILEKTGFGRWAQAFLKRVDSNVVPEAVFYQGIKAYQAKELDKAIELFSKILDLDAEAVWRPLRINAARTVARIYFEKEDYARSLEIYDTFLLRLNPMFPSDWLEAAWSLFYLKRYTQALSYLYNLEAPSSNSILWIEKYILRGLIYKQTCAEQQLQALNARFNQVFGRAIYRIKIGQPLGQFTFLRRLKVPGQNEYQRVVAVLDGLKLEARTATRLKYSALASQLYATEIRQLEKTEAFLQEKHLSYAAEQLLLVNESLAFLRFEMQRAKVDPDKVFDNDKRADIATLLTVGEKSNQQVSIAWRQNGDFWRSERLLFDVLIKDRCKR